MNSVDTGWVSDEDGGARRKGRRERLLAALDIVDGAARSSTHRQWLTGVHVWGQFLKDFKPTDW